MNLFKGLMFLQGHFIHAEDIDDDFTPLGNRSASERWRAGLPAPRRVAEAQATRHAPQPGLLRHLQFLGGRPMHAGHNLDVGEPFEAAAANDDGAPGRAACA